MCALNVVLGSQFMKSAMNKSKGFFNVESKTSIKVLHKVLEGNTLGLNMNANNRVEIR